MEQQSKIEDKPKHKTVLKPVFGNPWKRNQITGHIRVGVEDGTEPGPDILSDGTPLLTKSQLMEKQFEEAGYPTKGSQSSEDFRPE